MGLDDEFRLSLTEVRRAIEPVAAGLAARRRTSADIVALRPDGQVGGARAELRSDLIFTSRSAQPPGIR